MLAIILIVVLVLCGMCIEKIPAGYAGVVYNMSGGIEGLEFCVSHQEGNKIFHLHGAVLSVF